MLYYHMVKRLLRIRNVNENCVLSFWLNSISCVLIDPVISIIIGIAVLSVIACLMFCYLIYVRLSMS